MWVETCNTNREPYLINLENGLRIFIGATATPDEYTVERYGGADGNTRLFMGSEELAHRVYHNIARQLGALKIMPLTGKVRKFNGIDEPGVGVCDEAGQRLGVV